MAIWFELVLEPHPEGEKYKVEFDLKVNLKTTLFLLSPACFGRHLVLGLAPVLPQNLHIVCQPSSVPRSYSASVRGNYFSVYVSCWKSLESVGIQLSPPEDNDKRLGASGQGCPALLWRCSRRCGGNRPQVLAGGRSLGRYTGRSRAVYKWNDAQFYGLELSNDDKTIKMTPSSTYLTPQWWLLGWTATRTN